MEQSAYDRELPGYDDLRRTHMAEAGYANQHNNNSFSVKDAFRIACALVGFFGAFMLYNVEATLSEMSKGFYAMREDVAVLKNKVVTIEDNQKNGSERGQRIDRNVQELVETKKGK